VSPGRIPSRATRPDAPARTGHPDALAVCARVRLALAYHAAASTPGRPVDVPELAQAMGANLNALRAVLAGHRGPPSSWGRARGRVTLERLAQALGCPVEALAPTTPPHAVLPLHVELCGTCGGTGTEYDGDFGTVACECAKCGARGAWIEAAPPP
jgi:hypothetical protein